MSYADKVRLLILGLASGGFLVYHLAVEREKVTSVRNRLTLWRTKSPATFGSYWDKRKAEEQNADPA